MQTREPRKRVNWVFVIILIIVIPLIVFTIYMMNTIPSDNTPPGQQLDSSDVNDNDSLILESRD
jgi:hypothetical protein